MLLSSFALCLAISELKTNKQKPYKNIEKSKSLFMLLWCEALI